MLIDECGRCFVAWEQMLFLQLVFLSFLSSGIAVDLKWFSVPNLFLIIFYHKRVRCSWLLDVSFKISRRE